MSERIPFLVAMEDDLLFGSWWKTGLSLPQRAALKIFYGCPLTEEELVYWSIFQGGAVYNELGEVISVQEIEYLPQDYEIIVAVMGRRSGKSSGIGATIVAYEASLGGHEDYIRSEMERAACFLVAQDTKTAAEARSAIHGIIAKSPILKNEVTDPTKEWLVMKNGIVIGVIPPTAKSARGWHIPVAVFDEIGVWHKTVDAANPDFEVERAVRFAQLQFPHRKRVLISSPYIKEGLLYNYYQKGTHGKTLVLHAPTATMGNPLITHEALASEREQDAEAFERECNARFVDALSSFLSPTLLQKARATGIREIAPQSHTYVAAMDPAFRRDAFAFTIGHRDHQRGFVQDLLRWWRAPAGQALNPLPILAEIAADCKRYKVASVTSDQHQIESLSQLAEQLGLYIHGMDMTRTSKPKIWTNFQQLLNAGRVQLLDIADLTHELLALERTYTKSGHIDIQAPRGRHDDLAIVTALCAYEAMWTADEELAVAVTPVIPTIQQLCMETIKKQKDPWYGLEGNDYCYYSI